MRLPKKIWLFGLPAILLIGFAVLGVLYLRQRETIAAQQRIIDAQTESAYHALANDLNDLNVTLKKLEAAATPARLSKGFSDVRRLSAGAVRAASLLPGVYGEQSPLMQFLTRAGDYAETLLDRVLNGQMLTEEQLSSLSELGTCCDTLSKTYDDGCSSGDYPTGGSDGFYADAADEESIANYPSLLYDGPFSESSEAAEARGLPAETIDEATAAERVRALFPDRTLTFDGRTEGTIATYDFSGADNFCVSITERGGELLYFMSEPQGDSNAPPNDAESERLHAAASGWLKAHGFGEMSPSYAQYYAGTVVLNYAAVQDGVILYADLVKVYVDRDTAAVIGMDAQNYRFHHRPRTPETPLLSEQDARDRVSDALTIEEVSLALIPKCNTLEVLCYECKCTRGDTFFIVYINAQTGAEEEIFEVINSDEGDLVV